MSIGDQSIGEAPVGAQNPATGSKKAPRNRQIVAKADAVAQPEAR